MKIEDSKLPDRLKNVLRRNGYFEYEEIKEFVCIYGKIEESVFDDGQIYINVITSRFENISQIESFIERYDNLATACG